MLLPEFASELILWCLTLLLYVLVAVLLPGGSGGGAGAGVDVLRHLQRAPVVPQPVHHWLPLP